MNEDGQMAGARLARWRGPVDDDDNHLWAFLRTAIAMFRYEFLGAHLLRSRSLDSTVLSKRSSSRRGSLPYLVQTLQQSDNHSPSTHHNIITNNTYRFSVFLSLSLSGIRAMLLFAGGGGWECVLRVGRGLTSGTMNNHSSAHTTELHPYRKTSRVVGSVESILYIILHIVCAHT